MQKIQGVIGFNIPVQILPDSNEVKLTPAEVMAWQKRLPSDLGQSAKKIYRVICDCNQVLLEPHDRFQILELIATSVQYICQALSKHYLNQMHGLTTQQLTIAHLATTLHEQMANGYKLVVEQSANRPDSHTPLDSKILSTALHKIIYHFTQIILISYELYSTPPQGIWKELHLIYQYAEKKLLLQTNDLENEYKCVLVLAATYPYQRRQSEQTAIYKASQLWSTQVFLRKDFPNTFEPGFLVIDAAEDNPPMFLARDLIKLSATCKILDVHALLSHLKTLLTTIEPNELQARIDHNEEPEYAVPSALLKRIIKNWETPLTRANDRTNCNEQAQVCIGFPATHFYLNGQRHFQQHTDNQESENFTLTFSTRNLQEESLEIEKPHRRATDQPLPQILETEKTISYPLYPCTLVSESPRGYGLAWPDNTYPPMQSGEIIGIARSEQENKIWEICTIRWLLHLAEGDFKIGVERLSKTAIAAAAQLIKNGKPSGYFARCLILESSLLVPVFPFKTGSHIILMSETRPTIEIELTTLVDTTSVYNQFQYAIKSAAKEAARIQATLSPLPSPPVDTQEDNQKNDDIFDSVWSKL